MRILSPILLLASAAFANSNAASKLFVCATPQNADINQAAYEALDWVEITAVGSVGETGLQTNILNYDTWGTAVIQKAKGMTDAGSPEVEVARIPDDPGQTILELGGAVGNVNNYAFKELRNDGTVRYNRGLITGPRWPGGRNEDFDLQVFTLGFQQEPIVVNPAGGSAGVPPTMTVAPVITTDGTPAVGEVISLNNGTFTGDPTITYVKQWYRGGVAIAGATGNDYTLVAADVGKVITGRVQAINPYGTATGFSAATPTVIA